MNEQEQDEEDRRASEEMRRLVEESRAKMLAALTPEPTDIDTELFRLLMTLTHRVSIELMARINIRESAMTLLALQLLAASRPPGAPRELATALGCSRPAATQLVNRMEGRGLVERSVGRADRRARTLVLTSAARHAWKTAQTPLCVVLQTATSSFTSEQKEQLATMLRNIERDIDHARLTRDWGEALPKRRSGVHVR